MKVFIDLVYETNPHFDYFCIFNKLKKYDLIKVTILDYFVKYYKECLLIDFSSLS